MNERPSPRTVSAEVVHVEDVTSRWRRVVIDTKEAQPYLRRHFERVVDHGFLGAFHIALFFPVRRGDAENWPRISGPFVDLILVDPALYNDPEVERVTRRMYTVRPADADWRHLELNFAVHGDGLALGWALRAEPGMPLLIDLGGRVADATRLPDVGTYLFMGDETSVPSIASMLERLPATSRAFVHIEGTDSEDEWTFKTDANATIEWVHRGGAEAGTTDFLTAYCQHFAWPSNDIHVWAAAEGGQIRALRAHLRNEVGLTSSQYELMGYWRRGIRTEQFITVEAEAVNGAIAEGLDLFAGLARLRPAGSGSDQDRKTPYENIDIK